MALVDDFKDALASWASGVAVLSTWEEGQTHGITVSSFTSVSLEPPLVLACVGNEGQMVARVQRVGAFAVSLLAAEQVEVSNHFATSGRAPSPGPATLDALLRQPVTPGVIGHLGCTLFASYPGGDHTILVGRVHYASAAEGAPLLYWRRGYRGLAGL